MRPEFGHARTHRRQGNGDFSPTALAIRFPRHRDLRGQNRPVNATRKEIGSTGWKWRSL